ncbi:MAG: YHS domain-containing protein [Candidatus Thermochlorobacter sp.]
MKALLFSLLLLGVVGCSSGSRAEKPFNEVCPVMGEKVNPRARTVQYEGKTYGFCCNGCDKKFAAEPARYAANLSADGKEFIGQKQSTTH